MIKQTVIITSLTAIIQIKLHIKIKNISTIWKWISSFALIVIKYHGTVWSVKYPSFVIYQVNINIIIVPCFLSLSSIRSFNNFVLLSGPAAPGKIKTTESYIFDLKVRKEYCNVLLNVFENNTVVKGWSSYIVTVLCDETKKIEIKKLHVIVAGIAPPKIVNSYRIISRIKMISIRLYRKQ